MSSGRKKPRNTKSSTQERDTNRENNIYELQDTPETVQHEPFEKEADIREIRVEEPICIQEVTGVADRFRLQIEPTTAINREATDRAGEESIWEKRFKLL